MNVYAEVAGRVLSVLEDLKRQGRLPADLTLAGIEASPPRDAAHGDVASNAAMVLAKPARMKPRDIAEMLVAGLAGDPRIAKVEIAGPGFVNVTLAPAVWQEVIPAIRSEGARFGRIDLGKGERVNVEYVSANPTGPMHVGHCRGAVFGDALANLLAFAGYQVTREYYINDAGSQVDVLARSAFLRYREALGEAIGDIPAGLYPGDYLKPVGAALAKAHGAALRDLPEAEWLPVVRETALSMMMDMIRDDLAALDIRHDVFFSEASLKRGNVDEVADSITALRKGGHVYVGRLEKPKGHDADDWEDREQTLFRSTAFGDDVDRALLKSDGGYTYFASDLAYHHNKLSRGFTTLINVFGADHAGYIKRITAVVEALSAGKAALDIKVCQLVRLLRDGQPVKMSKRAGMFVTLREVVDEVGRDPVRFMMLYRKNDATLDFDLTKVIEQSKENPVFYVQMAHARACSVFRNVAEAFPDLARDADALARADLTRLDDAGEQDLVRRLAWYPELVSGAARAHEPHRIAFYLYDLASAFHGQWSRGNDSPHLRFIQPGDRSVTVARLALVDAVAHVIASGLGILGVSAPEELR
ncbi:MAG: arginine--tRNA ligase [Hyphomicrobiales bacterium]|nr:arginine--tRNA ligase [Hyphomicrobiales bacterium]